MVAHSRFSGTSLHRVGGKILEQPQRLAADLGDGSTIDEIVDLGEFHALAGGEAFAQARRARRLAEDEARGALPISSK